MEPFLRGCRAALNLCERGGLGVHVVLGNEACDLDSMVSAIAFAYFLTKTSPDQKAAFVPVLNIPRSEFPLRAECSFLLRESQLCEDLLMFRDEIDIHELHRLGRLTLTLVDHNVLPRGDAALEEVVTEVIDHRPVERQSSPGCVVTAELVGSCATLVTERIVQRAPNILDKQLAYMLRSTIVLDCINMIPEAGKVTPKDTEYVALLESKFPNLPPRAAVFDSLQKAKFDVSGLTTEQMLRKDMKVVTGGDLRLAISAVYMKLEDLLLRPCLKKEFEEFCRSRGYDVLVAMTISFSKKNEPFRQLAVYSPHSDLRELVSRELEESEAPSLQLEAMDSPCSEISAYRQENSLASRKKVLPIIMDLLRAREAGRAAPERSCRPWETAAARGGGLRGEASRDDRHGGGRPEDACNDEDVQLPPTPMNSLVEGCPLDGGLPKLTPEAILEKFNQMATEGPSDPASTGRR
ncbi:exopolyphosphatase PRUNE1 isoform X2 [Heptranchias perlo]|uniref:exopolyphosphatase PRUNE1 isoform X2 n=1 Tax=Heptranchias perlo TaxID=212740 RepID=UPI0035593F09